MAVLHLLATTMALFNGFNYQTNFWNNRSLVSTNYICNESFTQDNIRQANADNLNYNWIQYNPQDEYSTYIVYNAFNTDRHSYVRTDEEEFHFTFQVGQTLANSWGYVGSSRQYFNVDYYINCFEDYNSSFVLEYIPNTQLMGVHLLNVQLEYNLNIEYYSASEGDYYYVNYPFVVNLWETRPQFANQIYTADNYYDYAIQSYSLQATCKIVNLNELYTVGYNDGYTDGESDGYADGYNYGFELGQGSGDSWKNILGAIIDTPILYLRKFFGYEVFGVNIYGLLATLISLIVALSVFRLIRSIV